MNRPGKSLAVWPATAAVLVLAAFSDPGTAANTAPAYGATIIHSFGTRLHSGQNPYTGALTLGRDGDFYGATQFGGANKSGTIFKMKPDGTVTTLYSFSARAIVGGLSNGPNADGALPFGGLVQARDGSLYGVTPTGGANNVGTVFKITPKGAFSVLHTFSAIDLQSLSNVDGAEPNPPLLLGRDGNLYGTTYIGGKFDSGVVFRLQPDGTFTTLHNFGNVLPSGEVAAYSPESGVIEGSDGNLYGTTSGGGPSPNGKGAIYQLSPDGTFKVLHNFDALAGDGEFPLAPLVEGSDGAYYGTTQTATIFRITSSGDFTVLHAGNDQGPYVGNDINIDGSLIYAGLVNGGDGYLYGTMIEGGEFGLGSIYRISPSGAFATLYYFGAVPDDSEGAYGGLVLGGDGNLYGTTTNGGDRDKGTVFKLPLPAPAGWGTGPAITISASLTPSTISLSQGQTATVTWSSVNAAQCHVNGQTVASSGDLSVAPTKTGTYSYDVSCDGSGKATSVAAGLLTVTK